MADAPMAKPTPPTSQVGAAATTTPNAAQPGTAGARWYPIHSSTVATPMVMNGAGRRGCHYHSAATHASVMTIERSKPGWKAAGNGVPSAASPRGSRVTTAMIKGSGVASR